MLTFNIRHHHPGRTFETLSPGNFEGLGVALNGAHFLYVVPDAPFIAILQSQLSLPTLSVCVWDTVSPLFALPIYDLSFFSFSFSSSQDPFLRFRTLTAHGAYLYARFVTDTANEKWRPSPGKKQTKRAQALYGRVPVCRSLLRPSRLFPVSRMGVRLVQ